MKLKRLADVLEDIHEQMKGANGTVYEMLDNGIFPFQQFRHDVLVTEYERLNNGGRAPKEWHCVLLAVNEHGGDYEIEFGITNLSKRPEGVHTSSRELRVQFFIPKKPH